MGRKHGATLKRQQNRRNRDRQHSKPEPAGEPDRKPDVDMDPRDIALGWLRRVS